MLGYLGKEIKVKNVKFVTANLHGSQQGINQDCNWYALVVGEYFNEAAHHELSYNIIIDIFNQRKGKNLVKHRSLIVPYQADILNLPINPRLPNERYSPYIPRLIGDLKAAQVQ